MRELSVLDRIVLLAVGGFAAYQIVVGLEGLDPLAIWAFSVAFGVLLLAGLLIIILGYEALNNPLVVIVAALLPLGFSVGLVAEYLPRFAAGYLAFALVGLAVLAATRFLAPGTPATVSLAVVHGVSGILIFILPFWFAVEGSVPPGFILVGIGGALIGLGGLLLMFLKMGKPLLSEKTIFSVLPWLLLVMTAAFVVGLATTRP